MGWPVHAMLDWRLRRSFVYSLFDHPIGAQED